LPRRSGTGNRPIAFLTACAIARDAGPAIAHRSRGGEGYSAVTVPPTCGRVPSSRPSVDSVGRRLGPYPVQRMGTELLQSSSATTSRWRRASPTALDVRDRVVVRICRRPSHVMTHEGVVHGDLSPYNVLVWNDVLVFIDFPQAVDPQEPRRRAAPARHQPPRLVARKGVDIDPDAIFRDPLGSFGSKPHLRRSRALYPP
jgi:hypothetical protein